jgi:hypothetical protein
MFAIYAAEYGRREGEMDGPSWQSQRKTYLEAYFYLWPKIEKTFNNNNTAFLNITFSSIEEKEMYPDHSIRMTPDLDALLEFIVFLKKNQFSCEFYPHPTNWIVGVYKE